MVKETTTRRIPLQRRAVKKHSARYKGSWELPDSGRRKFSDYELERRTEMEVRFR